MSRAYEALTILKAAGTDAELVLAVKQAEDPIQKLGGHIDSSASWGRRRLAYRIAHQQEGVYHLIQFHLEPQRLDELKRALRLNEHIVRFLILNRANHHPAAAHPAQPVEARSGAPTPSTSRVAP